MLSSMTTSRSTKSRLPLTGISGANLHSLLHHDFIHGSLGNLITLMSASMPVGSSVRQWNWYDTVVCLLTMLFSTLTYLAGYLLPHFTHNTWLVSTFESFHLYLLPVATFQSVRKIVFYVSITNYFYFSYI